jgi:hypothetical protein
MRRELSAMSKEPGTKNKSFQLSARSKEQGTKKLQLAVAVGSWHGARNN